MGRGQEKGGGGSKEQEKRREGETVVGTQNKKSMNHLLKNGIKLHRIDVNCRLP